jgi:chitosanase
MALTSALKDLARVITATFEHGVPELIFDSAEIIDSRGYTVGVAGFTTGTGDALVVIQEYCSHLSPSTTIDPPKLKFGSRIKGFVNKFIGDESTPGICSFIPRLQILNEQYIANDYDPVEDVSGLSGFAHAWKSACRDPAFINAQLKVYDDLYMLPAEALSDRLGLGYAISRIVIFDSYIQHGESGLDRLLNRSGPIKNCRASQPGEIQEINWILVFLNAREWDINNTPENMGDDGRPLGRDRIYAFRDLIKRDYLLRGPVVEWTRKDYWGEDHYKHRLC